MFINFIVLLLCLLVSVSFYSLFERKSLSLMHIRQGPAIVSLQGILQPFSDAIKLFSNEIVYPLNYNFYLYVITPWMAMFSSLGCWIVLPYSAGVISLKYCVLLFFVFTTLGVYAHLGAGWSSNSNYALIGSLRSVAQSISYEVSFAFLLILVMMFMLKFNLLYSNLLQADLYFALILPLISGLWLISALAETNRAPFDFAEGESELVSGFNIEYGSTMFAMLFIGEYGSMIFMSMLFGTLFFGGSSLEGSSWVFGTFIMFFFIWIRGSLPRSRYDKLMSLCWLSILPISLILIMMFMAVY